MRILTVPGLWNSGPQHWQAHWEAKHPDWKRVQQRNWDRPDRDEWVATLDAAIQSSDEPAVLAAHSLGCSLVAQWVADRGGRGVAAAFLVGPSDVEAPGYPEEGRSFSTVPMVRLPFPSIVVASSDDPYVSLDRARQFASAVIPSVSRGTWAGGAYEPASEAHDLASDAHDRASDPHDPASDAHNLAGRRNPSYEWHLGTLRAARWTLRAAAGAPARTTGPPCARHPVNLLSAAAVSVPVIFRPFRHIGKEGSDDKQPCRFDICTPADAGVRAVDLRRQPLLRLEQRAGQEPRAGRAAHVVQRRVPGRRR